jgi:hypothetical protein
MALLEDNLLTYSDFLDINYFTPFYKKSTGIFFPDRDRFRWRIKRISFVLFGFFTNGTYKLSGRYSSDSHQPIKNKVHFSCSTPQKPPESEW